MLHITLKRSLAKPSYLAQIKRFWHNNDTIWTYYRFAVPRLPFFDISLNFCFLASGGTLNAKNPSPFSSHTVWLKPYHGKYWISSIFWNGVKSEFNILRSNKTKLCISTSKLWIQYNTYVFNYFFFKSSSQMSQDHS